MRRRRVPILLVAVAFLVGACGDGDDSTAITEATLQGYLLTQDDVPTGFTQQEVEEEEDDEEAADDTGSGCLEGDDDTVPSTADASAEFATADGTNQISHEVEAYEPGKAEEAMAEARRMLEKCKTFSEPVEGTTMTGSLGSTEFASFGDDTAAFTLQASIQGISVNGMFVVVRKGDVISGVGTVVTNAPIDRGALEGLVRKAVEKLP
ncbi:MAG TPA: hypothetical protein VHF47_06415 [Acidimicrobiales bacterium]|nr:hypothetical protein [Acidimicrobiales bacterium]